MDSKEIISMDSKVMRGVLRVRKIGGTCLHTPASVAEGDRQHAHLPPRVHRHLYPHLPPQYNESHTSGAGRNLQSREGTFGTRYAYIHTYTHPNKQTNTQADTHTHIQTHKAEHTS